MEQSYIQFAGFSRQTGDQRKNRQRAREQYFKQIAYVRPTQAAVFAWQQGLMRKEP